jgi:hypothetical protein
MSSGGEVLLLTATTATSSIITRCILPLTLATITIGSLYVSGIFSPGHIAQASALGQFEDLINTVTSEFNRILFNVNEITSSFRNAIIELRSNNLTSANYSQVLVLHQDTVNYAQRLLNFFNEIQLIIFKIENAMNQNVADLNSVYNSAGTLGTRMLDEGLKPLVSEIRALESILRESNIDFTPLERMFFEN